MGSTSDEYGVIPEFHPRVNLVKPVVAVPVGARFGGRFWALLWLAYYCIGRGVIFDFSPLGGRLDVPVGLQSLSPFWLQFYGVGWLAAAGTILWAAVSRRWSPLIFAVAAVPALVWALVYLYSTIYVSGQSINGFLTYQTVCGTIYFTCRAAPDRGWNPVRIYSHSRRVT